MAKIQGRMSRDGLLDVLILKASKAPELGGLGIVITDREGLSSLIGSHVATVKGAWAKLQATPRRKLTKLHVEPKPEVTTEAKEGSTEAA